MLKKKKNEGYLLLESSLAFFLLTSLILLIIPLLLFFRERQQQGVAELEIYRFFSELASQTTERVKISNGVEMTGLVIKDKQTVKQILIETEKISYDLTYLVGDD